MERIKLKDFERLHKWVWNNGLIIPNSLGSGLELRSSQDNNFVYFATIPESTPCWYCSSVTDTLEDYLKRTEGGIVKGEHVRIIGTTGLPLDYKDEKYWKDLTERGLDKGCIGSIVQLGEKILHYGAKSFKVYQIDKNIK